LKINQSKKTQNHRITLCLMLITIVYYSEVIEKRCYAVSDCMKQTIIVEQEVSAYPSGASEFTTSF